MTELVNGRIPAHTECPYKARCAFQQNGTCKHKGVDHNVPFSCAVSRAFVLIDRSPVSG